MSNYKGFRTGSNSYGQFWFGGSTFPGFLYKKNLGAGGRRSTQFTPGGTITCNQPTDLYNKYKPGGGGVGASSMSNRRAKNRLATVCLNNSCFPCYNTLGQYSNYTHNPKGFIPCPAIEEYIVLYNGNGSTGGTVPKDTSSPYIPGSSVIVLGNTGNLTRSGYRFVDWNTKPDGSGRPYYTPDIFSMPPLNVILYAQWASNFTVTYNSNGSTSGSVPVDGSLYNSGETVVVLGNTGTLTRTGYTFSGWTTNSNGSGTVYNNPNEILMPSSNVTFYAKWTPVGSTAYTVIYDGNGVTGGTGTVPVDVSSPYNSGLTVTVLGNSGTLVKLVDGTTYQFAGWNTMSDGSGTNYVAGNTFTMPSSDTTLYANWIIGGVRLRYFPNSSAGGSGTAPSSSETYYTAFSTQPVVGNTGSFINTISPVFAGWNTASNGSGTSYPVGSNIIMPGGGTVTLHAQWIPNGGPFTLTYDGNGATSGTVPPSSGDSYSAGQPAIIVGNTGSPALTNSSLIFNGWNTAANGLGTSYPAGSYITMNTNKILYAQWGSLPSVTVTYDANGGSGTVPAETNYPSNVQVTILGQGSLTKSEYTFLGWNSSSTGEGSLYVPGYTFTSKTVTLYAQWAKGSPVKSCAPSSLGGDYSYYYFPYAMIIKSSDTVTIYTTALIGTTSTNVGSGTAPEGLISISSKVVIKDSSITINTNTTYANSANNYNYSKTLTNGDITYWPSGETISSVTFPTIQPRNSGSPPTYNSSARTVNNGCGLTSNASNIVGGAYNIQSFFVQGVTLNYSDGSNTQFISCPTDSLYSTTSGSTWSQALNTWYPYAYITPRSSAALTVITIIPSTGTEYVSPGMPNYTVQYDGNGATGGSLPNPQYFGTYTGGTPTSVTISGNTGSLTKSTSPSTFSRWNTAANGSGTDYGPGYTTTYAGGSSIILYAQWV